MKNLYQEKIIALWKNTGIRRLTISISIVWLSVFYFISEKDDTYRSFLLFGLLPVSIIWLGLWTIKGAQQYKKELRLTKKRWFFGGDK